MQPKKKNPTGTTEILRMPDSDSTSPDLSAAAKPANPTLAIVKGPHTGQVFSFSCFCTFANQLTLQSLSFFLSPD